MEMSCAFQSGSASVYLEIQWWFLRGPEDLEPGAEVAGAQVAEPRRPQRPVRLCASALVVQVHPGVLDAPGTRLAIAREGRPGASRGVSW